MTATMQDAELDGEQEGKRGEEEFSPPLA